MKKEKWKMNQFKNGTKKQIFQLKTWRIIYIINTPEDDARLKKRMPERHVCAHAAPLAREDHEAVRVRFQCLECTSLLSTPTTETRPLCDDVLLSVTHHMEFWIICCALICEKKNSLQSDTNE